MLEQGKFLSEIEMKQVQSWVLFMEDSYNRLNISFD